MALGEGPNWSRRVPSKKFKICDPPFYECPQIPNFHSGVKKISLHFWIIQTMLKIKYKMNFVEPKTTIDQLLGTESKFGI